MHDNKIICLKPDPAVIAFLNKIKLLMTEMPEWKQGVLDACARSSNSTARPITVQNTQ